MNIARAFREAGHLIAPQVLVTAKPWAFFDVIVIESQFGHSPH